MTLSRADVEAILLGRAGAFMSEAGMDATTTTGDNESLNGPIAYSLAKMGATPSDVTFVTDSDMGGLSTEDFPAFIDIAYMQLLSDIHGNLPLVDIQVGPRKENLSQLVRQLERRMAALQDLIIQQYGIGVGSLEAGSIDMNFQTLGDDVVV
jgi:hypothetical protein